MEYNPRIAWTNYGPFSIWILGKTDVRPFCALVLYTKKIALPEQMMLEILKESSLKIKSIE